MKKKICKKLILENCPKVCPNIRMSSTRASQLPAYSNAAFLRNFSTFAPYAWKSYDGTDLKAWARAEASRYYHEVDRNTPFAQTYSSLCDFADIMLTKQESLRPLTPRRQSVTALQRDKNIVSLFVSEGDQTSAETRLGRATLNSVLYREYSRWWDAFVAEAEEDTERNAPSASDRFSWHCAKILGRQTGLKQSAIAPVVAAWLIEKA